MDKDTPADPLAGLVEFPLPPEVSLWPQTWPSRIVIVLLIVGLITGLWWFIRWWHVNRYRRAALTELDTIVSSGPAAGSLAVLVRRTALAAFPRAEVAGLSGRDWLAFLDSSYGGTGFSQGPGKILAAAPYEPSAKGADDNALVDLVRRWIRTHRG